MPEKKKRRSVSEGASTAYRRKHTPGNYKKLKDKRKKEKEA